MHEIELKPSRLLGLLLAGMVGLAWAGLWLAALPPGIKPVLGVGAVALALHAWRGLSQPVQLRLRADGYVQLRGTTADWEDVEVLDDSFVSPALIVLRYRRERERPHALTLLPDSADAEGLRRLRVSLRWTRRTHSDTSSPGAG